MKRKYLISVLIILISLIAISCDNKTPEVKSSYSIKGKTFHIDFNKTRDTTTEVPDSMTITLNDDASELTWTSIYSNYGEKSFNHGTVSGNSAAESEQVFRFEETVTDSEASTSLEIRFNDEGSVSITGKIADNNIPPTSQSTAITSEKSDSVQNFVERAYFGTNGSIASYLYFNVSGVQFTLYTNAATKYQADKASGFSEYKDISDFPMTPLLQVKDKDDLNKVWKFTYDSDKDIFKDSNHELDSYILRRIK